MGARGNERMGGEGAPGGEGGMLGEPRQHLAELEGGKGLRVQLGPPLLRPIRHAPADGHLRAFDP